MGKCNAPALGKVAIVGLGLMGGSLAGALRPHCRIITGVDRDTETLEIAKNRDFVDIATPDLAGGVRDADIVILATPVRTILRLLQEIGPLLPEGCLLMDIGSTKTEIMVQMETLPDHTNPLGGHPMCGKEVSGIEAAEATLYQGKTFVLTPLERTSDKAIQLGEEIVAAIRAQPLRLAPQRHDQLVATISHLPYLVASSLVKTAAQVAADDPMVWEVAASGFRDTSRVAASDITMMLDILMTNREAVLDITKAYMEQLDQLKHMLDDGNEEQLRMHLETIQRHRKELQFG